MEKCVVCLKITDKCCGLCRKVFYCSAEHQEVHWGMSHKYVCQGKYQTTQYNNEDFKIYQQQQLAQSSLQQYKNNEQKANIFLQLFSQRLQLRKHLLMKYISIRDSNIVPTIHKQLIKEALQLYQLSKKIADSYQSSLSQILQQRGLITNNFIIKVDQLLDKIFLAKCYQICSMQKQLKQILLNINNQTQNYPSNLNEQFASCYKNLLSSIIDVSQLANLDKISQKMFGLYIKLIQRFQGIWEQVYAYFNMGMWYSTKTYNQKALKCFLYSLDLIQSHKMSKQISESSSIFKGDAMYNIAICRYLLNEKQKAIQNMQEAYKLRSLGLGKSSIEASSCLLTLSKWHLQQKKYDSCLQFVMECYRIRKNNPNFYKELLQVNSFIVKMYQIIRKEKQQNINTGNSQQTKYFDKLLEDQQAFRQIELQNKQSFTKRLLDNQKQMVTFKLIISPELADTLSSVQWSKVSDLIDLIDTEMQKEQAIRIIFQSQFSQCLDEEQRNAFIKLNKLI